MSIVSEATKVMNEAAIEINRLRGVERDLAQAIKDILTLPAIQGTHYERHLREVLAKAGEKPYEVSYE